jgi:hypothetical protein
MLITAANKAPKKGLREKDQQKRKVAVYNRKIILEPPEKATCENDGS